MKAPRARLSKGIVPSQEPIVAQPSELTRWCYFVLFTIIIAAVQHPATAPFLTRITATRANPPAQTPLQAPPFQMPQHREQRFLLKQYAAPKPGDTPTHQLSPPVSHRSLNTPTPSPTLQPAVCRTAPSARRPYNAPTSPHPPSTCRSAPSVWRPRTSPHFWLGNFPAPPTLIPPPPSRFASLRRFSYLGTPLSSPCAWLALQLLAQ